MNTTKLILAAVLVAAPIATAGCRKSADDERKEAVQAAQNASEVSHEAQKQALDERNEYLAALRREQLDYRSHLHDELQEIDHTLNELHADIGRDGIVKYDAHAKEAERIEQLVRRRTMLRTDLDALESSTPEDWDTVKSKLDADLGDRRTRRGRI